MPSSTAGSSKPPAKAIPNPRRLLILTPPTQSPSIIPPLLHTLSGVPVTETPQTQTQPEPDSRTEEEESTADTQTTAPTQPSFAGYTTHSPLHLSTKYYTADVPIWVDEVPLSKQSDPSNSNPSTGSVAWKNDFLGDEAQIVREAVGALVIAVQAPRPRDVDTGIAQSEDVVALSALIREIGAVKGCIDEERGGMDVPGVLLLVGPSVKSTTATAAANTSPSGLDPESELGDELGDDVPLSVGWWEDRLFDMGLFGWEVVEWDPLEDGNKNEEKTRNKFGEYEGMPRVKEVLETHDWSAPGEDGLEDDLAAELLGFDRDGSGFGMEVNELEREMLGLRMAIEKGGGDGDSDDDDDLEEDKVESMETLIMRTQSLRDMGSELPDSERRKFAAKAVQDIMREL